MDYRVAAPEEHGALIDILSHAFAVDPKGYPQFFARAGHDNLRVVVRDGEVLGGATLVDMGMYFGGRSVPLTGVAGVAVRPDQLRRGVASSMMSSLVRELAERGVALSALYASTAGLYRRVGYEAAGTRFLATMIAREIPFQERELTTRRPMDKDEETIRELYRRFALHQSGFLDRGPYIWPRITAERFGSPAYGLLVEADGEPEGYVYYRKARGKTDRHELHVTDMVATTSRAVRRVWTVLRDMGTMVDSITIPTSTTDPFQLALPDPRHAIRLYDRWMVRITNLRAAIEARGWPPGLTATLQLDVTDELVEDNGGKWIVHIENGRGSLEPGGSGAIRITARGLASLYSGYASPAALALMGQLDADPDKFQALAAPFVGPEPWMRDYF